MLNPPALRRLRALAVESTRGVPRARTGVPLPATLRHWWLGLKLQGQLTPANHALNAAYSFHQPRVFTPRVRGHDAMSLPWLHNFHPYTREVTVHFGAVNHMQTTPELGPPTWYIRYDAKPIHRNKSTGWNFASDSYTFHTQSFATLEDALRFCQREGLAYTVFPPRLRRFQHKSYADNFVWKGPPRQEEIDY